ncbi:TPR-like protein, partial [Sistotremastrum niveocremeum HHB9708]
MESTPPPHRPFAVPPIQRLQSPTRNRRVRHSLSESFSFGPQSLVNSSLLSAGTRSPTITRQQALALDPNASLLYTSPRFHKRTKKTASTLPPEHDVFSASQGTATVPNTQEEDEGEDLDWGPVDRMRLWRHDAMMQHLHETAAFWGDKILSWTNDPNDAFWLAQIYFMMHRYARAERILTRPFPLPDSKPPDKSVHTNGNPASQPPAFPSLASTSMYPINEQPPMWKGKGKEEVLTLDPLDEDEDASRLVDMSVACRYLAAQCLVSQGKWAEAVEMLGESNPFKGTARSGPTFANNDGGLKVEASMCHLRGVLMLKLNRTDRAKECFMEALALDVKCFDAFEHLVGGEMMTADEEWEFVQGLAYREQTPEDADFVKLIYVSRLKKYKHIEEQAEARRRLVEDYRLMDNPDILHAFADALYVQFRWQDCYTITSRILDLVVIHAPTMPLYIACMYHLPHLHSKLFMRAHEMVDREPEAAITWYAVGMWYLTSKKWGEARKYFSKTSLMDPRFAPAWIAFGHTFALEGEHDHAVTAYSTAARLFQGSHLPLMFVGMEHLQLSNLALADEALKAAHIMCNQDPLLMNELGVLAFHRREYPQAVDFFLKALSLAEMDQSSELVWTTTYVNLGTSYRKIGHLEKAKECYEKVLNIDPRMTAALSLLGIVYHMLGNLDRAIDLYHEVIHPYF